MAPGITYWKGRLLHRFGAYAAPGTLGPYAGLPVGVELFSRWQTYYNTFQTTADLDTTNDWTVVETAGGATQTLSDDVFPSYMRLLDTAADNDATGIQYTAAGGGGEMFRLVAGKKRYFEVRFRTGDNDLDASSAAQLNIFMGFQITNTDLFGTGAAVTDFLGFYKDDGTGLFRFVGCKDNAALGDAAMTSGISLSTGLTIAAADTVDVNGTAPGVWHTLAFLIQSGATVTEGGIYVFVDGVHTVSSYQTANLCDDEELALTLALQAGEAGGTAHVLDVEHVLFAAEL